MSGDARVLLCVDETCGARPYVIGLDGEDLDSQKWLLVETDALQARSAARAHAGLSEVWVVSADDVEPINLAAALKDDRPDLRVCLIDDENGGSLRSRAYNARIDFLMNGRQFVKRYADAKRALGVAGEQADAGEEPSRQADGMARGADAGGSMVSTTVPGAGAGGCMAGTTARMPRAFSDDGHAGCSQPEGFEPRQLASGGTAGVRGAADAAGSAASSRSGEAPPPFWAADARAAGRALASPGAVPSGRGAYLLPVLSGSGGAGKSTIAALSAVLAQQRGMRTLLIDFDLQFGDMAFLLGVDDALGIDELLSQPGAVASLHGDDGLPALLAAPARLESADEVAHELPRLLDLVTPCFDLVVANTGSVWADQHAGLLERCTGALFVVDQRTTSVRACQHALELCARCGIATGSFKFAVNRCSKSALFTSIDVSCALQGADAVELRDGGRELEDYLGGGQAREYLELDTPFARDLDHLLADMVPGYRERGGGESERGRRRRKRGRGRHRSAERKEEL